MRVRMDRHEIHEQTPPMRFPADFYFEIWQRLGGGRPVMGLRLRS
ncbi:MAG: hypothetical protein OXL36_20735 [Bryobacterales bacterium]|nr:hypothetical protein [Bryobacterales bacterium]MDE0296358.1 hypothetical protein [Bryobacterales bacterium]